MKEQVENQGAGAIGSLVLSVVALPTALFPMACLPIAVAALILGLLARRGPNRALAIAGIALSSIALLLMLAIAAWGAHLEETHTFRG